jgi:hypothetical protein
LHEVAKIAVVAVVTVVTEGDVTTEPTATTAKMVRPVHDGDCVTNSNDGILPNYAGVLETLYERN